MKKFAVLLAATAALVASPALAQEANPVSFFVGPVVGYESVSLSDGVDSDSSDGIMYGVVAGADFQVGNSFFLGLEGEYTDSDVSEHARDVFTVGDEVSIGTGRNLYLGVRAGVPLALGSKVYVKGGYVNTRMQGTYDDGVDLYSAKTDLEGWQIGAGVQASLNPVVLRIEYRYADLNELKVLGVPTGIDASRHQVVVGALFGF